MEGQRESRAPPGAGFVLKLIVNNKNVSLALLAPLVLMLTRGEVTEGGLWWQSDVSCEGWSIHVFTVSLTQTRLLLMIVTASYPPISPFTPGCHLLELGGQRNCVEENTHTHIQRDVIKSVYQGLKRENHILDYMRTPCLERWLFNLVHTQCNSFLKLLTECQWTPSPCVPVFRLDNPDHQSFKCINYEWGWSRVS